MNEHYTSSDGTSITNIIDDNGTKDIFLEQLKQKQDQLRILDSIYHNHFFKDHDYKDFVPPKSNVNNGTNEQAIVKYY